MYAMYNMQVQRATGFVPQIFHDPHYTRKAVGDDELSKEENVNDRMSNSRKWVRWLVQHKHFRI